MLWICPSGHRLALWTSLRCPSLMYHQDCQETRMLNDDDDDGDDGDDEDDDELQTHSHPTLFILENLICTCPHVSTEILLYLDVCFDLFAEQWWTTTLILRKLISEYLTSSWKMRDFTNARPRICLLIESATMFNILLLMSMVSNLVFFLL